MKFRKYKNFQEAFEEIIKNDREYTLIRHRLVPNDKIRSHYHRKANEWLIVDDGKFKARLGNKEETFDLKKQVITIYFPSKKNRTIFCAYANFIFCFAGCERYFYLPA